MTEESAQGMLEPCPFCGSEAQADNGFLPAESIIYAWCKNTECPLNSEIIFTPDEWNTRASAPVRAAAEPGEMREADDLIGQIEERFPNWKSYRDLVDCIDCTLHALRGGR